MVEVTSSSTRNEDLDKKKNLYERLGVEEYFLFDPYGEYLSPRLQGHRLEGGRYTRILPETDGSLLSRVSGLLFRSEGQNVRLIDARTGERLLWIGEMATALQEAEERARREAAARKAAEEELARLRAELERERQGG